MKSRYDYMRASTVEDTDGTQYPDPLTINYQSVIDNYGAFPNTHTVNLTDIKKLWVMFYNILDTVEMEDVLLSAIGIEHAGLLEPGDTLYLYSPELVEQFTFKDLTNNSTNL